MRILVLTNLYPPHYIGGYELGCRDVVEGLKARGHDTVVLTSVYKVSRPQHYGGVYRWLQTDLAPAGSSNAVSLLKKEIVNRLAFKRVCKAFGPEVIYVWNPAHISISNVFLAQEMRLPLCFFVSDHWLSSWENDLWYSLTHREPRRLHRRLGWRGVSALLNASGLFERRPLELRHVQFASRYLKQAALNYGKPTAEAEVIHWGVDVNGFKFNESSRTPLRLLYVGQVTRHKGVHTALEALKIVRDYYGHESAQLTIVGGPDYDRNVERLVHSLGLEGNVRLTGLTPREHLPDIYREHDVLIFPSVWDEPFSITVLEAMSSGLGVVGTDTGGSSEVLRDEVNALIFPKEDAEVCARQIGRLMDDPVLFQRIRRNARRTVELSFRLEDMLDKIEASLERVVADVATIEAEIA